MSENNDQSSVADSSAQRPKIRVLPDRVINQIAAGEVVERPAAVVKELLENALDAKAERIEIEFRGGGKSLIRVEDNGLGMTPDEALLALERHATSKLREAADLSKVLSLGFRGEALPSIASVSRFTLRTRARGWEHGTEIFVNGGNLVHQRECGMPTGTRIEVANLFNSVPARRKFLKSDATESAHITHLVRLHAVARPGVSFALIENGRSVFSSPKCPGMRERVAEIWGRELADELIEIEPVTGENGMRLTGLIGKPGTGRATRRQMIALVNGRPVDSRTLNYALIEGYHSFIPKGRYPLAFLFLEIDPSVIDVNIHPAKREIKFRHDGRVRQFVLQAVIAQLQALAAQARHPVLHGTREDFEKDVLPRSEPKPFPLEGLPAKNKAPGTGHNGTDAKPEAPTPGPTPAVRPATAERVSPAARKDAYPRTQPGPVSDDFKHKYLTPEETSSRDSSAEDKVAPDKKAQTSAPAQATLDSKTPASGNPTAEASARSASEAERVRPDAQPPEPSAAEPSAKSGELPVVKWTSAQPKSKASPDTGQTGESTPAGRGGDSEGKENPAPDTATPAPAAHAESSAAPAQPPASSVTPVTRADTKLGIEDEGPAFRFEWRCLGVMRDGYAVFETPAGLVLMNRRAAHERVWFERLQKRFASENQPSQRLLFPVGLELEPLTAAALQENLGPLQAHGFGIEPFGKNFFRLESHPDWLPQAEAETFVRDLIERLREGSLDLKRPAVADEALARLAVARAIRPSDTAGCEEMTELARALLQCEQPLNCPRGRPTYFELTSRELARRFGR